MKKTVYAFVVQCLLCVISYAQTNTSIAAFSKSYNFEGQQDYDNAIKTMMSIYDVKSYEQNLRLGWLYYKKGNYVESAKHYQLAINLKPNALEAKQGYLYPLASLNNFDNLIAQYNKILELDPLDINANYQLGYYYYNKANMLQATKYFQKILDLYPSGYEPYLRSTLISLKKLSTQNESIVNAFNKSYDAEYTYNYQGAVDALSGIYNKNYYDVNLRLGWLYYKLKNYTESLKYYQQAIELKPNALEPRLGIVLPASMLGNTNQVEENYKKILQVYPENTTANYQMGLIYYYKKDYVSAHSYFEKLATLYPFDHDGLLMYAWSSYQVNKAEEAKNLFNKVLMNTPNDKSALEGIALLNK